MKSKREEIMTLATYISPHCCHCLQAYLHRYTRRNRKRRNLYNFGIITSPYHYHGEASCSIIPTIETDREEIMTLVHTASLIITVYGSIPLQWYSKHMKSKEKKFIFLLVTHGWKEAFVLSALPNVSKLIEKGNQGTANITSTFRHRVHKHSPSVHQQKKRKRRTRNCNLPSTVTSRLRSICLIGTPQNRNDIEND
ncbi:hypothetical protein AVEN_173385-1 [Araneus ventricosus]|uniref:Uncharacterized protein n=1 Tax=Araneus ventricosus TaxID=182803 RepID=A0A4Y2W828_ARAVE|nr:hypothetical protein AVEN_173385-1 [Araneus ventricosus]